MFFVKSPFWLRWIYPSLIWHKPRGDKSIYLTFDDGPVPVVTPFVLHTLKNFNAKATFFCIGENAEKNSGIYEQVLQAGHAVGNHTYNHLKGWHTGDKEYIQNVDRCSNVVHSNLFRPPYGRGTRSQYSILKSQYSIIMWDVLSGDFYENLTPENCLKNVIKNTRSGSIVVFHDSLKAYPRLKYVLPLALAYWQKEGYSFEVL
ncbi:MAG TPA: polysaccharide deacetylase family protein [Sphingobacteriaceae bacterium]|nr:polysaccharide deacetylase family protein [Sphingobacteriaceae bacterium]